MGHLVKSISGMSIVECYRVVEEAHDYLAQQGAKAIRVAWQKSGSPQWGSEVKRVQVPLPGGSRPRHVDVTNAEHNLGEVINQCATIERLLDTLVWAQKDESGLSKFYVAYCHPTTSSGDNDLVLVDSNDQYARFEVFDGVRNNINNKKERESLKSLGVWHEGSNQESRIDWLAARRFLVVSRELAPFLRRAKRPWRYIEIPITEWTSIFEIKSQVDV